MTVVFLVWSGPLGMTPPWYFYYAPQNYYAVNPSLRGKMSVIARKTLRAQRLKKFKIALRD